MRGARRGHNHRPLRNVVRLVVVMAATVAGAASVAGAAQPLAHRLYKGVGSEKVHGEETSHPKARARFRVSTDGKRVSYFRVAYWLPCAKQRWWSVFYAVPVNAEGRFRQHSGGEYEGGPVGEETTYIFGRFIEGGERVRFHFRERARVYTGHNDPARLVSISTELHTSSVDDAPALSYILLRTTRPEPSPSGHLPRASAGGR
jgi:hypothetical protein